MKNFKEKLRKRKFELHLTALLLMLLPPIPMYFAAQNASFVWIWLLIGIVISGNLLVIIIP